MAGVVGGDGDVHPLAAVVHRVLETLGEREGEYPGAGGAHGHGAPRVPGHGGGQGPGPGAGAVQVRHLDGGLRPRVGEQRQQRDQRHQGPHHHKLDADYDVTALLLSKP